MITEYIEPSEIVIEGEGEGREDPNVIGVGISDQLFQLVISKDLDLDIRVLFNIGGVIEKERNPEGVGVGDEGCDHQQSNGKEAC